jgi:hypothetical protein
MGPRRKTVVTRHSAEEQEMRDQEVLRASKELAAYFSGQRTEREARAALKVIKAFVRDRERLDAKRRPPLPSGKATKAPKAVASHKAARDLGQRHGPKLRRTDNDTQSKAVTTADERPMTPERSQSSASDDRTDK